MRRLGGLGQFGRGEEPNHRLLIAVIVAIIDRFEPTFTPSVRDPLATEHYSAGDAETVDKFDPPHHPNPPILAS
jgi:hypothetical protein